MTSSGQLSMGLTSSLAAMRILRIWSATSSQVGLSQGKRLQAAPLGKCAVQVSLFGMGLACESRKGSFNFNCGVLAFA